MSQRRISASARLTRLCHVALALGTSLIAAVVPSRALAETNASCIQAAEKGQDARDRGALRVARAYFVQCAADECPKSMRGDCVHWLDEVDASLPSIVVGAKDAGGADLFDVRVKVDGAAVEDVASGRPIVLDPGPHVVRFERGKTPGGEVREVKVLLRTGERNRSVVTTLQGARDAAAAPPASGKEGGGDIPTSTWILGGAGLLSLGSFGTFALLGAQEKSRLRNTCSPACSDGDVAGLRTDYLVADISLAVGVVALGIASYFLLTREQRRTDHRLARTLWK